MKEKYRCRIEGNNDEWQTIEASGKRDAAREFVELNDDGDLIAGDGIDIEVKDFGRGKKPVEVVTVWKRTEYST